MSKLILHNSKCVINDLPYEECVNCASMGSGTCICKICQRDNTNKRLSYDAFGDYTLFICVESTKKRKVFDEYRYAMKDTAKTLVQIAENALDNATELTRKDFRTFTHNTKTIVAHAVQDLDLIIKQNQSITTNVQQNIKRVQDIIINDPETAALLCLRLSKHLLSLKAEYMSYDILHNNAPMFQPTMTNARNVIITILHMFYAEFKEKSIYIEVDEWRQKSMIDYMTFQMAIYYIIENALKYAKNESQIRIKFKVQGKTLIINFEMVSIYLESGEENRIFEEGYSGKHAIDTKKRGSGIGMYNAKKLIELNQGSIEVDAGEISYYDQEVPYANNTFMITLPFA